MLTHHRQVLYAMGILYSQEYHSIEPSSAPAFIIRPGRSRRSRRSAWQNMPPYLSFDLSNDSTIPPTPIDHHPSPPGLSTPLSLPPAIIPPLSTPGDWTFIHHAAPHPASPASEPETWILLSDDS